jgi:two-component system OmpR family sensor kinase
MSLTWVAAPRRQWRRLPLRIQLVAVTLVLVIMALAISGVAASAFLRGQLVGRVDNQLQSTGTGIAQAVAAPYYANSGPPQIGPANYIAVFGNDGSILQALNRSRYGASAARPVLPQLSYPQAQTYAGQPFTAHSTNGSTDWRVLVQPLANGNTIVLAQSLEDVQSTMNQLTLIEVLVGLAVLLLLAGVAYAVVRTSLRRLVEVEQTAGAIAAGDLSRRVPVQDSRTEVGRLGLALNAMLSQVERAFHDREASESSARASEEKMRRFVADASHELRTPLTSIRGFAELHRQGAAGDPEAVHRILARIESEAQRMGLLVDDLLLLARLDQQRPLEHRPVDLLTLAADAVAAAEAVAPDRPVRLVAGANGDGSMGDAPPVVAGDEARLRQVLGNLMSNALRYTPAGSPVEVRVFSTGSEAVLEVSDSGPGLAPEDAERVFERFYRADPSRTRSGAGPGTPAAGGSGLGLSIVAALVAAHGGRVTVQTVPGAGATFSVRLPLAD